MLVVLPNHSDGQWSRRDLHVTQLQASDFFFPYSEVGGWGVVWDYQIRYIYIQCKHSLLKKLFMHTGEYTDVLFCKIN